MKILVDGNTLVNEDSFHDIIDQAAMDADFGFYGRNLNALWDVLTAILPHPLELRWVNTARSRDVIGPRFDEIIKVIRNAENELGTGEFKVTLEP